MAERHRYEHSGRSAWRPGIWTFFGIILALMLLAIFVIFLLGIPIDSPW